MEELCKDAPPIMLVAGLHKAGKTSILKVVLERMAPHEANGMLPTLAPQEMRFTRNPYVNFTVYDLPGSVVFEETKDNKELIKKTDVVVFVIDAQEGVAEAVTTAKKVLEVARGINEQIMFNVVVNKLDEGLFSNERKTEMICEIQAKLKQNTDGQLWGSTQFHCTSIFDYSVNEAFSKIIQQMVPDLPSIRSCLDVFNNSTRVEKTFLFDVLSKTCIAYDASGEDSAAFELCTEALNLVVDISVIYTSTSTERDFTKSPLTEVGSTNVIHMENGNVMYIRGVDTGDIVLICFFREEDYDKPSLIAYNFEIFQKTLPGFHVKKAARQSSASSSVA